MTYTVQSGEEIKISLNEKDRVRSILQNVRIILSTQKGTCPFYRDFGVEWSVVDRPETVIRQLIASRVKEAVETFEPRVRVLTVTPERQNGEDFSVKVEVEIIEES